MRWMVIPQNVITYQASVVGAAMTINFYIVDTNVVGTPSTALRIAIPESHVPAARVRMPCTINNGGGSGIGMCEVVPGDRHVSVFVDQTASTDWTSGANTGAGGSITFQIVT